MNTTPKIAVLIPCYNEAVAIAKVVDDFRAQLPDADIYVFDNCCTDDTASIARDHGAIVVTEPRKGKGYVIESMFDRVSADYYVMVDGDDTYDADGVHDLLKPVLAGDADMAVGARLAEFDNQSFRPLHVAGNGLVRGLINSIFKAKLTDILSGYRAYNNRVVSHIPIVSSGFEVETELTIQMLYYRLKMVEVPIPYRSRPEGSVSKLRTIPDGFRVLRKLFSLFKSFKPLAFFGGFALVFLVFGILAGIPPVYGFLQTNEVRRFPLAILATGLMLLSAGSFFLGLMLQAVNGRLRELHNVMVRRDK